MPEGDTIFRAAHTLQRALAGQTVTGFTAEYAHLVRENDNKPLSGHTIERVEARGKWLLMYFSDGRILLTHMRMNGSWHLYRPGERWRWPRRDMRIVIETPAWIAVGFSIPVAEFHSAATLARKEGVATLGPDLLGKTFDRATAIQNIQTRIGEEIGSVLLRQSVLAGVGNVYKSEVCFACGVNPFQRIEKLHPAQVEKLVDVAERFLTRNVQMGGRDERRTTGSLDPQKKLWVYGRAGEPCRRCGASIQMHIQGPEARTTYWCPECQPLT